MIKWGRILARHGVLRPFEDIQDIPASARLIARVARFGLTVPPTPQYAHAFEAIGPAAIKLGQALATRPDLIGAEAAHDLQRLQDKLPAFPFAQVKATVERELGGPIEQFYSSFDEKPIGAASIAQVHKAITLDGRTVAVKVLRPHIEEIFATAITTYDWAAARLERLGGEAARLRPRIVIDQFRQWVDRELNFRLEAANAAELASRLASFDNFHVPGIDWERTGKRVLTMEWIDGIPLTDRAALAASGHDLKEVAATVVRVFLQQAIVDGYFHADFHQGNLLLDREGRLVAVDFGIMGRLDRLARRYLAEILYGLITRNYTRVAEIHFEAGYVPPYHSVEEFATALRAVGDPILGKPVSEISVGQLLEQLFTITRIFEMQTQPHLLLLQKTMVMVEGVASSLDPDANMWEIAQPFLESWIRDELSIESRAADEIIQFVRDVRTLPSVARRLMELVPQKGAAPPLPPLPDITVRGPNWWMLGLTTAFLAGLAAGWLL